MEEFQCDSNMPNFIDCLLHFKNRLGNFVNDINNGFTDGEANWEGEMIKISSVKW